MNPQGLITNHIEWLKARQDEVNRVLALEEEVARLKEERDERWTRIGDPNIGACIPEKRYEELLALEQDNAKLQKGAEDWMAEAKKFEELYYKTHDELSEKNELITELTGKLRGKTARVCQVEEGRAIAATAWHQELSAKEALITELTGKLKHYAEKPHGHCDECQRVFERTDT